MKTPVALLIFNRPESTQKVFEAIRQARPEVLLVVADGPRGSHEIERCKQARVIIDQVDWPCQVLKNYSDINLGCKNRVSSGLNWVFDQTEQAIILEDDCLPDVTFFRYCEELLEQYKDDERIMTICGSNRLGQWKHESQSYHFSLYGACWGWASWRRAWKHYDVAIQLWSEPDVQRSVQHVISNPKRSAFQKMRFDAVHAGEIDTWDIQWMFSRLIQAGLSIIPSVNLISNIGFGAEATHTKWGHGRDANRTTSSISFPLERPKVIVADREFDNKVFQIHLSDKKSMKKNFLKLVSRLKV
jgi:hypothetical protein